MAFSKRVFVLLAFGLVCWVAPATASAEANVEVMLAFDMTSSMRSSVEQATQESRRIISEVRQLDGAASFSVAQFRDYGNTVGDYELLRAMTGDLDEIESAFRRLRVAGNGTAYNRAAESYSLAFRRSYSDASIGWRPESRKLVVIFGDAEPYGAGSAGLAGCRDRENDPYGLNVLKELDAMRAAGRNLMMVRISSPQTTASAECYASMVRRVNEAGTGGGSVGGSAGSGGSGGSSGGTQAPTPTPGAFDLGKGTATGTRIERTLALIDLTISVEPTTVRRTGSFGVSIRMRNPNRFAIQVGSMVLRLPAGATYRRGSLSGTGGVEPTQSGRLLAWNQPLALDPGERRPLHIVVVAGATAGKADLRLRADLGLPTGNASAVRETPVGVAKRIRRVTVTASGRTRDGVSVGLRGTFSLGGARQARVGRVVVSMPRGRRVELNALTPRVTTFGHSTLIRMPLVLSRSVRLPGCKAGTRGYAVIRASKALDNSNRTADAVTISVRGCRSVNRIWRTRTANGLRVALRAFA